MREINEKYSVTRFRMSRLVFYECKAKEWIIRQRRRLVCDFGSTLFCIMSRFLYDKAVGKVIWTRGFENTSFL